MGPSLAARSTRRSARAPQTTRCASKEGLEIGWRRWGLPGGQSILLRLIRIYDIIIVGLISFKLGGIL